MKRWLVRRGVWTMWSCRQGRLFWTEAALENHLLTGCCDPWADIRRARASIDRILKTSMVVLAVFAVVFVAGVVWIVA